MASTTEKDVKDRSLVWIWTNGTLVAQFQIAMKEYFEDNACRGHFKQKCFISQAVDPKAFNVTSNGNNSSPTTRKRNWKGKNEIENWRKCQFSEKSFQNGQIYLFEPPHLSTHIPIENDFAQKEYRYSSNEDQQYVPEMTATDDGRWRRQNGRKKNTDRRKKKKKLI
ncbi:hypothetical protein RFI_34565 [Reticulomyxa filosa]|uniref:Uncharacterized protein n=1 Tax=Reticulomyxa filosa TaxID=46433 RepID=X6LNY1_RETFI|nr:hypothetical protein RFI_34565 [Reticulomyxa filosa]|eukprot:ETO02847.1 hypothetical protein RFI_34565 [Reticulomyxa filosa]